MISSCSSGVGAQSLASQTEMKIALLTGCRDRHYAFGLITALISRGLCLDVIGSDEIDSPELHRSPSLRFLEFERRPARNVGFVKKTLRLLDYYGRLIPYAAAAKPEIFHTLWNYRLEYFDRTLLMLYYKLLGKKVVLTAHNINAGKRDSNDSWLNRLTLRIQYRLTDHFFVHTSKMKTEIVNDFHVPEQKITLIPFGINNALPDRGLTRAEARQQLGIDDTDKTILFFGNLGPYKGLDILVPAFQRIAATNSEYRLIIAGKPRGGCEKYVAEIEQAIRNSGIQDQVQLRIGFVPDDLLEAYFKAADLLVLPYRFISQSAVLFMGYSFGLPVVATDVGCFGEDVIQGRTGFVCKPDDPVDLAGTIERYFASDLYQSLDNRRQEIRNYANERYSWEKVSELTLNAYKGLLQNREPVHPRADNLQTENRI